MNNEDALGFFEDMAKNCDRTSLKLSHFDEETIKIDIGSILENVDEYTSILDLGSGTGLIINEIYEYANHITAVEPIREFSDYIVKSNKIEVVTESMFDFTPSRTYDLITIFATMHYFNESEAKKIYKKYVNYLSPRGILMVKNQLGVKSDVIMDKYSEELGRSYYACYRYYLKEISILMELGFEEISIRDIYPKKFNRFNDTHYYLLTAYKTVI